MKRRIASPARTKLIGQVVTAIGHRSGCMIAADFGTAILVFVRRKFTAVQQIAVDSFQPYTSQKDVAIPVPLILIFDAREGIDKRKLARYHALGGDSVLVKTLKDATEALDRG